MFTGIVGTLGTIVSAERRGDLRVVIDGGWSECAIGESIAVNGACLTVVEKTAGGFAADLSGETLARTAPRWNKGDAVNLERALKLGDRLDGHMVTGHIDGLARIIDITQTGDSHVLALETPPALSRFIAEKGSVTLDGISLTVNNVEAARFWVNIIPHTWSATTLNQRKPGDALNMEVDMIARYVARLLQK